MTDAPVSHLPTTVAQSPMQLRLTALDLILPMVDRLRELEQADGRWTRRLSLALDCLDQADAMERAP